MNIILAAITQEPFAREVREYLPWCLFTFLVALALSLFLTPILIEAAKKHNIVDRPDGALKNHKEPVPYLGGLGIYIAFVATLGLLLKDFQDSRVLGVLLAGSMVLIMGLIDDFGALSPPVKFMGQFLAAFMLIKSGIRIEIGAFPDYVNFVLTCLWIVGMCNAFNIIDVLDGLAGGVGAISGFCLFIMVTFVGNNSQVISLITLALTGATLGFLRYNFRPRQDLHGRHGKHVHRPGAGLPVHDGVLRRRPRPGLPGALLHLRRAHLRHAFRDGPAP